MTWFTEYRLGWIREMLVVYGYVNRGHIEKKFGVSTPQASEDLKHLLRRYPDEVQYNASSKRYEAKFGIKPAHVILDTETHNHGNR